MGIGSEKRAIMPRNVPAEVENAGIVMMIKRQTLGAAVPHGDRAT